eukprot:1157246-Pelagomonas_calceolata.AAC.9
MPPLVSMCCPIKPSPKSSKCVQSCSCWTPQKGACKQARPCLHVCACPNQRAQSCSCWAPQRGACKQARMSLHVSVHGQTNWHRAAAAGPLRKVQTSRPVCLCMLKLKRTAAGSFSIFVLEAVVQTCADPGSTTHLSQSRAIHLRQSRAKVLSRSRVNAPELVQGCSSSHHCSVNASITAHASRMQIPQ